MAEVKFTARDEQFIAACSRMNGAVGALAAKMNIQLVNSFKQSDFVSNNFAKGLGRVADQIQTFGQNMSTYVTLPIVTLGGAMAKTFMDIDTLKRGLVSVMGSASAAEKEFVNLREVAKLPGLGLEEAAQGSVMLQAAGMSAAFARRELLSVGNALATVGKGKFELERVNNQLVQIYNKTSGFGEDVKTISQSLPQLRKVMLEAFGTMDTAAISKKFTGKEFVEKLVVELEKLPKATGGFKNAWENLTDSLKIGGYEIFKIAEQSFDFTGKLDGLAQTVETLVGKFKELSPETQTAILSITGIAAAIGPLSLAIGATARALPVLATGFGVLASPIAAVGLAIGGLIYYWDTFNAIIDKTIARLYQVKGALLAAAGLRQDAADAFQQGALWWDAGKKRDANIAEPQRKAREEAERQAMLARNAARRNLRNAPTPTGGGASPIGLPTEAEYAKTEQSLNKLNSVLDRQKSNLDKLKEAAEEYSKALRGLKDVMLGMDGLKPLEIKQVKPLETTQRMGVVGGVVTDIPGIKMPDISGQISKTLKSLTTAFDESLTELRQTITDSLRQTATDAFVGVGEVVGAMMAGTAGVKDLGRMLGSTIGGVMQQIGKALIGFGVAKLKIDTLIAIPGAGAAAAIAGGALIVGLGSALKSISQPRAFAKGGIVGSPTRALFGEYIGASNNPEIVSPLSNLLGIIQKAIQPVMLNGVNFGSGQTSVYSESRLRGEDLYISQLRTSRINTALRG